MSEALPDILRSLAGITQHGKDTDRVAAARLLVSTATQLGLLPKEAPPPDDTPATSPTPDRPGRMRLSRTISSVREPPVHEAPVIPLRAAGAETKESG